MRVMLLEPDPCLRRFLAIYLEERGHEVAYEAGSGHVAIQHLARDPAIDVVLAELRLPIADGLDVLAATRTLRGPRVVLSSGHWTAEEVALARDLGAAATLGKPLDLEALDALLDEPAMKQEV